MGKGEQDDLEDTPGPPLNREIGEKLRLISEYYRLDPDQKVQFKAKAYQTASITVSDYEHQIKSGAEAEENIEGVGKSIAEDIQEYLDTGRISRLDELEAANPEIKKTLEYFMSLYGIGVETAAKFFKKGYRTLKDLWDSSDLTEAQRTGILWRNHINRPVLREEIDLINETLYTLLSVYDIEFEICGSYRRGEPVSGDVDVLIRKQGTYNMEQIIGLLREILPAYLAFGSKVYRGIIRLSPKYNGHRIDIRLIEPEYWPFALLYFTGSGRFNILMRSRAISLGLTLSEYSLYDENGKDIRGIKDERDIFTKLGVKFLTPKQRTKILDHLTIL